MEMVIDRGNSTYTFPRVETSGLEERFLVLVGQWRRETGMLSLVQKMVIHPAYQRIIGMGQPVVPLILRELEREPDHWFWALEVITGANPVQGDDRGLLDQMAAAWLKWGRDNGYGCGSFEDTKLGRKNRFSIKEFRRVIPFEFL